MLESCPLGFIAIREAPPRKRNSIMPGRSALLLDDVNGQVTETVCSFSYDLHLG